MIVQNKPDLQSGRKPRTDPIMDRRKIVRAVQVTVLLIIILTLPFRGARADVPGNELVVSEVAQFDGEKETIGGAYPGLLLIPNRPDTFRDSKYHQTYHAVCYGYRVRQTLDSEGHLQVTGYARRFSVHAPDAESLPFAKKVARLLMLLWNARHARLFPDHPGSAPIVEVWLTRQAAPDLSADIGGEQFKNQIYLYNVALQRRPIEWTREIAHEYGHYALPGVSGYTAPEEWANGVLGERLFLRWFGEDLAAKRFESDALPFVTPEDLNAYLGKQVAPLIRRVATEGLEAGQITRKDATGMDYYIGLALYLDAVYGSKALLDGLSYTQPGEDGFVHATDFLHGMLESLRSATEFTITPPDMDAATGSCRLYLPGGDFEVATRSVRAWQFAPDPKRIVAQNSHGIHTRLAGWYKLTLTKASNTSLLPRLTFHKK